MTKNMVRGTTRNQAIEILRIIAAFGIVAYHASAPFQDWAYGGLAVFLILSPYVDCAYNLTKPRKFSSLLAIFIIPWIFWIIFYGAVNFILGKSIIYGGNIILGVLYGTSVHLWYMPAMFVFLVLVNWIKVRISPRILFWVTILISVSLLSTVLIWRAPSLNLAPPQPQWIHSLPLVLLGVSFGLILKISILERVTAVGILTGSLVPLLLHYVQGVSITYVIGIVAVAISVWVAPRFIPEKWNVETISSCMLGVYLTHVLWLMVFNKITGQGNYYTVTFAYFFSLSSVWLVQRLVPVSRLIIGAPLRSAG